MEALVPIISLFVVVAVGLLVTRIGTAALVRTGLSKDLAHFQSRSAFLGIGFTTEESERVMDHPLRRRIVMWLMLLGNAGFVAAVSAVLPVFVNTQGGTSFLLLRVFGLMCGLFLLWAIAASKWVDKQLSRVIGWALQRWTRMDLHDYHGLLQLGEGYTVCEMKVEAGDWVAGKNLAELRLGDEGVQVLGIQRADGEYIGAPTGRTYLRRGDKIVIYGRVEHLAELDQRRADGAGDAAHAERVEQLHKTREETNPTDRTRNRADETPVAALE